MGQKVSPNGLRYGIIKQWESRWYADKKCYVNWLHQDIKIRYCLNKALKKANISKIEIERTEKEIVIFIKAVKVGLILGQEGKNISELIKLIKKNIKNKKIEIKINVSEIKIPDIDAKIIANNISEQIVNRASFRTVQKIAIRKAMKCGAKGIKTSVSGRLGGVDMARTEGYSEGIVPLATIRSDIDYAFSEALTTYGKIGVKVWICKGEILDKNKSIFIENNFIDNNRNKFKFKKNINKKNFFNNKGNK